LIWVKKLHDGYGYSPETSCERILLRSNGYLPQRKNEIQTNVYLIQLTAPFVELLTVAINDTANTLFITGITGFLCHQTTFNHELI
jgi:hypothetical protein